MIRCSATLTPYAGDQDPPSYTPPSSYSRAAAGAETVVAGDLCGLPRRDGQRGAADIDDGAAFDHRDHCWVHGVAGDDLVTPCSHDGDHAARRGDLINVIELHCANKEIDAPLHRGGHQSAVVQRRDVELRGLIQRQEGVADIDLGHRSRLGPERVVRGDGICRTDGLALTAIDGRGTAGSAQAEEPGDGDDDDDETDEVYDAVHTDFLTLKLTRRGELPDGRTGNRPTIHQETRNGSRECDGNYSPAAAL